MFLNAPQLITSKLLKSMALSAFLLAGLSAVGQPQLFKETVVIDTNRIKQSPSQSPKEKSEWLAQMGEVMVNPTGFMYADKVFDDALSIDPTNKRAQFYKEFLKPMMTLKGVLKRVEPLIAKEDSLTQKDFSEYTKVIVSKSGLQKFLLEGHPNMTTEADIQNFIEDFSNAQNSLRSYLKYSKSLKLDLRLTVSTAGGKKEQKDMWKNCYTRESSSGVYVVSACKYLSLKVFKMDRPDIEVLQHITAGLQMYTIMATSYDATGVLTYTRSAKKGWSPTEKELVGYFQNIRRFGRLRSSNTLGLVRGMGSDILAGAKWAKRMQHSLCPYGERAYYDYSLRPKNRSGHIFDGTICIGDETSEGVSVDTVFTTIEMALQSQALDVFVKDKNVYVEKLSKKANGVEYETQANVLAPLLNPVADLKDLLPTQFDACGDATNVGDATMAGIFPAGDAQEVLALTKDLGRGCRR